MRLIDADALVKALPDCDLGKKDHRISFQGAIIDIYFLIDRQPTIDPVKHGHWINEGHDAWTSYTRCSACGKLFSEPQRSNYCPNCGARMDGEQHDG